MANVTTEKDQIVTITGLDTDWSSDDDLTQSRKRREVYSIQFSPSAANDVMVVHDGGIDALVVFKKTCAGVSDDEPEYYSPGVRPNLVIDISDCTLDTPANALVKIVYR